VHADWSGRSWGALYSRLCTQAGHSFQQVPPPISYLHRETSRRHAFHFTHFAALALRDSKSKQLPDNNGDISSLFAGDALKLIYRGRL